MKIYQKWMTVLLSVVLIFTALPISTATLTASAVSTSDYDYCVLDDGTAEISGYNGEGGDIVIPSTIDGYTVTSIDDYAFWVCLSLSSVKIPETVTRIGE